MAELKTWANNASVTDFVNGIENLQMRADAKEVAAMMRHATGARAKMWGTSIVGYGSYHYKYASGREGDSMLTGFSPRKQALTIYIMPGFAKFETLMAKLGTYKTGTSCLYIKRLADIDLKTLETLIGRSVRYMRKTYDTR